MDDAAQFQQIMAACGGKAGKPSRKLIAFLREKGLTEEAVTYLAGYVLKTASGAGAIDFYSQDGWLGCNGDDSIPVAIRDGLLIVGGCPNGDPVAVDVREHIGAAGYIAHETMWQEANVRSVFVVLTTGLGALAVGLDAGTMPRDYYEAIDRRSKSN